MLHLMVPLWGLPAPRVLQNTLEVYPTVQDRPFYALCRSTKLSCVLMHETILSATVFALEGTERPSMMQYLNKE